MEATPQILIVSSELEHRRTLNDILRKEGYDTTCASRVSECQEALQTQNVSLIFCDRRISDGNYRDVVALTRASNQRIRVVVTSRLADWDEYLDAMRAWLAEKQTFDALQLLATAVARKRLRRDLSALRIYDGMPVEAAEALIVDATFAVNRRTLN